FTMCNLPALHLLELVSVLFFYLIIPQPPRSTLFPYTTLFRSSRVPGLGIAPVRDEHAHLVPRDAPRFRRLGRLEPLRERARVQRDRKSTRLNSSHVAISYAVFCLKKNSFEDQTHVHPRARLRS